MKGIIVHNLLVDIFREHPGKTVCLSLGRPPLIKLGSGSNDFANESYRSLSAAVMAEIINSLITDKEGAELKRERYIRTAIKDGSYLRHVSITHTHKDVEVTIKSRLVRDIEAEKKAIEEASATMNLIKG